MSWRTHETGNKLAQGFLFLFAISIFVSAGCALNHSWREKFSRVENIPPAPGNSMWLGYEQAMLDSRETGKPVVLFFTGSDWCKWCVRLKEEVFDTDEFQEWAKENVTMVEVDFPQDSRLPGDQRVLNETLKKAYGDRIKGFPTALFIDGNGNVIGKMGYESGGPKPWIETANKIVKSNTY